MRRMIGVMYADVSVVGGVSRSSVYKRRRSRVYWESTLCKNGSMFDCSRFVATYKAERLMKANRSSILPATALSAIASSNIFRNPRSSERLQSAQ